MRSLHALVRDVDAALDRLAGRLGNSRIRHHDLTGEDLISLDRRAGVRGPDIPVNDLVLRSQHALVRDVDSALDRLSRRRLSAGIFHDNLTGRDRPLFVRQCVGLHTGRHLVCRDGAFFVGLGLGLFTIADPGCEDLAFLVWSGCRLFALGGLLRHDRGGRIRRRCRLLAFGDLVRSQRAPGVRIRSGLVSRGNLVRGQRPLTVGLEVRLLTLRAAPGDLLSRGVRRGLRERAFDNGFDGHDLVFGLLQVRVLGHHLNGHDLVFGMLQVRVLGHGLNGHDPILGHGLNGHHAFLVRKRCRLLALGHLRCGQRALAVRLGLGLFALHRLLGPDLHFAQGLGHQVAFGCPFAFGLVGTLDDLPSVLGNPTQLVFRHLPGVAAAEVFLGAGAERVLQIAQRLGQLLLGADLRGGEVGQACLHVGQACPVGVGQLALLPGPASGCRCLFAQIVGLQELPGLRPDPSSRGQVLPGPPDATLELPLPVGPFLGFLVFALALVFGPQQTLPGLLGALLQVPGRSFLLAGCRLGRADPIANMIGDVRQLFPLPVLFRLCTGLGDIVLRLLDLFRDLPAPADLLLRGLPHGLCGPFTRLLLGLCIARVDRLGPGLLRGCLGRLGRRGRPFALLAFELAPGIGHRSTPVIPGVHSPAILEAFGPHRLEHLDLFELPLLFNRLVYYLDLPFDAEGLAGQVAELHPAVDRGCGCPQPAQRRPG